MCVIIVREPDVLIPHEIIKAAVENNPHGWGYVIPDRGKLEVRRHYNDKGTDPDDVYEILDDNMDKRVFLHLRWRTRGGKNSKNAHPFQVLSERKHGMQCFLMHNGTLSDFGKSNDEMCDTFHFGKEIVTPLLERVQKYTGKKGLLADPFVGRVINEFAGMHSVMTLVDNYGNYLVVNENKGVNKEGWWASNDYSFRNAYRTPAKETSHVYQHPRPNQVWSHDQRKYITTSEASYEDIFTPGAQGPLFEGQESVEMSRRIPVEVTTTKTPINLLTGPKPGAGHNNPPTDKPSEDVPLDEPLELADKLSFMEMWGLKSLSELQDLNEEDFFDMCTEFPEHAAICMRDLVAELYNGS